LDELRWILLGLGILAIGAIWLWSARGSRQAPGNAQLREPMAAATHGPSVAGSEAPPAETREPPAADRREWGVPPLEPLSIRTADFSDVPALDQPMLTHADPVDFSLDSSRATGQPRFAPSSSVSARPTRSPAQASSGPAPRVPVIEFEFDEEAGEILGAEEEVAAEDEVRVEEEERATEEDRAREDDRAREEEQAREEERAAEKEAAEKSARAEERRQAEHSDRQAAVAPPSPNRSEKQKIVTVRVCAVGDTRWAGTHLMEALEALGLAYGRYQVYHRNHSDGRSIFCVASLVEPGTFDLSTMPNEQFRGVSLFAVLPGPLEPMPAVEGLLATARELARALSGTMQDAKGIPFSPQRAEALLQDVARFQALLA
jgi:cell division protein ZipA